MSDEPRIESEICTSDADSITVRGRSLTDDLMGEMDLGSLFYFHVQGEEPSESEARVVNALLVTLVEHGFTRPVVASRLTYDAAPESLQGVVASGILGAGSRLLGTMEESAHVLQSQTPYDDAEAAAGRALDAVDGPFPGIGHHQHKPDDPRADRLFGLAEEEGLRGDHVDLVEAVRTVAEDRHDATLPVNATGAIAAVASDMGFDWRIVRGFAVVGRAVGIIGHVNEELSNPQAETVNRVVRDHVEYTGPGPGRE